MKSFLTTLILVLFCISVGFSQFSDDFSDGDFTNGTTWSGDNAKFIVNASQKLQLNGLSATDTAYLSTPSSQTIGKWEFDLNMDFQPSTSNLTKVFIFANNANLKTAEGYLLKIGETGSVDGLIFAKKTGGTETQLIKMMEGQLADTPNIRIRVERTVGGNWTFFVKNYKTGGDFVNVGTTTDNTITSTSHFGVSCLYSSTRKDKFFFDAFDVASVSGPDITPPSLTSLTALSINTLDVLFSEPVEKISAETEANYSVNNGVGTPSLALQDATNQALVHLTFSNNFPLGQLLTLNTINVKDTSDNTNTGGLNGTFQFGTAPNPDFRSIVINEIYPDPDTAAIIPEKEFIELFNTTANPINISNWKIADPTSTRILPAYAIPAGGFLILCSSADTALFSPFGPTVGVGTLPSLNNTGDIITLKDGTNTTIDSINYSSDWYHDAIKDDGGWTIEQINPFANCSGIENWAASNSLDGGTPGNTNSIFDNTPDTQAPSATSIGILDINRISVAFTETISDDGFLRSLFSIDNGITINSANAAGKEAIITLSPALDSGTIYRLIAQGIKDCPGNASSADTLFFTIGKRGRFNDVLITEIMADPDPKVQLPDVEYIELYNTQSFPINLSDWILSDESSNSLISSGFIFPNEYLVVCKDTNAYKFVPYGRVLGLPSFPSFTNSGEIISLTDEQDQLIFSVEYDDDWYANNLKKDGGWSLEMVDPRNPCGGQNNWKASEDLRGGTPGQANSVNGTNSDIAPINIEDLWVVDSNTIQIFFTEKFDVSLFSEATFTVDNGVGIVNNFDFPLVERKQLNIHLPENMTAGIIYTLTISGLKDCAGNGLGEIATIRFGLPQTVASGDLIINEILFNPRTIGYDFVEIYNLSDKLLTTKDLILAEADVITGETTEFANMESTGKLIFPKDYTVLTENPAAVKQEYYTKNPLNFLATPGMPNYLDDEGVAVLHRRQDLLVLDSLAFDNSWHFSLLDDEDGVSLERINFTQPTQNQTNWHSAAQSVGFATPGYLNSTYTEAGLDDGMAISPEIFSPDQDGFDDILGIHFTLDDYDYIANVYIYNVKGREVRHLVKNETLAQTSFYTWDGLEEDGSKADAGIYIIKAELFDPAGNIKKYKGKCVLAVRY
ncbi:MAG: lamin tail domain-containing protein [Chitinophagales bacterium]|nr:lamin tail domain-containing protein [Chitinophagales bacterium]